MPAGPVVTLEQAWRQLMKTMSKGFMADYSAYQRAAFQLHRLTRHR